MRAVASRVSRGSGRARRGADAEGGPAQATRILRFLALCERASADAPPPRIGHTGAAIRIVPGRAAEVGLAAPPARREDRVRFQVTHKLTTYLLVLVAMATLVTADLLSPLADPAGAGRRRAVVVQRSR